MHELEGVGLQNALNLIAGLHGPRSGGVELDVRLPVFQGLARVAGFFVGEDSPFVHLFDQRTDFVVGELADVIAEGLVVG
jgi:hypothetical protein